MIHRLYIVIEPFRQSINEFICLGGLFVVLLCIQGIYFRKCAKLCFQVTLILSHSFGGIVGFIDEIQIVGIFWMIEHSPYF
jgi:hypothetical protein